MISGLREDKDARTVMKDLLTRTTSDKSVPIDRS